MLVFGQGVFDSAFGVDGVVFLRGVLIKRRRTVRNRRFDLGVPDDYLAAIFQYHARTTRMHVEELCHVVGVAANDDPAGLAGPVFRDLSAVEHREG
jgi:hypothetical protein